MLEHEEDAMSNRRSHVYVGAARVSGTQGGLFRRDVGGGQWERLVKGLPELTNVRAITVHPANPDIIYIGTDRGPYRSADRGERWERPDFPDDGTEVWSILVHPSDPRVLYAGTSPVGVFRSDDGGDTWHRLPGATQRELVKMAFACRVMRLAADPARPAEIYAALEVGGVIRTLDGGERWEDCAADLLALSARPHLKSRIQSDSDSEGMLDAHAIGVSAAAPGTVFLAVRMGLFRSADRGTHWTDMEVGRFSPLTYGRDLRVSPHDPRTLYACLSPAARSEDGSLYRSTDLGATWTRLDHGVEAESTMMAVALNARDREQVHCATRTGQVFTTEDGGRTWRDDRLPADVRDVYTIACG
jgi:photosystem II stability/assembly factor-like uncharacterized protein